MKIHKKKFPGGYRFHRFEGKPGMSLDQAPLPDSVVISLQDRDYAELPVLVQKGDTVTAGQIIGRDDDSISNPVHATISGTVERVIKAKPSAGTSGSVIITSDGSTEWTPLADAAPEWRRLPAEKVEELVYLSGCASLAPNGIPTRFNSSPVHPETVKQIIVQGLDADVYSVAPGLFLGTEVLPDFMEGLKILNALFPAAGLHLALPAENKKLLQTCEEAGSDLPGLVVHGLVSRYPQAFSPLLDRTVLEGDLPEDPEGVLVLSLTAVIHVFEAVTQGKPLIERTIALCGPGFSENGHLAARVGAPYAALLEGRLQPEPASLLIRNSPLTGTAIEDLDVPLSRDTETIAALPSDQDWPFMPFASPGVTKDSVSRTFLACLLPGTLEANARAHGEERACIFCTYCESVCPAGIIPHLLYHYVKKGVTEDFLEDYGLFECLDCNLCSYVCTSKLPLAAYIKRGKDILTAERAQLAAAATAENGDGE